MSTRTVRYRFRLYPDPKQEQSLVRVFGCARLVHNMMVEIRESDFQQGLPYRGYQALSAVLTQVKHDPDYAFLNEASCVPLQQEVRRVEAAYKRFFGGEGGKPKYHGRHGSQSVEYTRSAFRNVEQAVNARWGFVTLAKLGRTRFRSSRTLPSDPSSLTVIRDPDGTWHVSFVVKEKIEPLSANNRIAAVDVGCRRLASMVTSDGSRLLFDNPKAYATRERRLARLQAKQARMMKGSGKWVRCQHRISSLHARIRHTRMDAIAKTASLIARENQTVIVETLDVKSMLANGPARKPVADAAMSMLLRLIGEQCDKHGRTLVKTSADYPSTRRCSNCGRLADIPLNITVWQCAECGVILDRDFNACVNLFDAAGLAESLNAQDASPARWEPTEHSGKTGCVGIPVL